MKRLSQLAGPVALLVLFLLCINSVAYAEGETETQTSTFSSQEFLRFGMVPPSASLPVGYPRGNGSAEIQADGALVSVHFQAEGMAGGAHFTLVIITNGTSRSVANMTTSYDGEVEAEASIFLSQGSYSVGLQVLDTSSFNPPRAVLVSDPSAQLLTIAQTTQTTTTSTGENQGVSTIQGGETEDDSITTAIQNRFIPAVVDVSESGSAAFVNDGNFSVSVGRYQQDGYVVSISAANINGPRVLLVNLTSSQARSLFSGAVLVTMDGSDVPQAGSLNQVLGAAAGSPARFVLVSTQSALQLLILIPHFSYHSIAILPELARLGAALAYDLPVLLVSAAALTALVAFAYSRRARAPSEIRAVRLR